MNSSAAHTVTLSGGIGESKERVKKRTDDANFFAPGSLGFARDDGVRA